MNRLSFAITMFFTLGVIPVNMPAWGINVSGVSYLPYAADAFPDPIGLLSGSLDRTKNTAVTVGSERDLRGVRDNTQTFVVSASEYGPLGVEVSAFVMNFEQYTFNASNSLGVELFPVNDPLGATIPSSQSLDSLGTRIVSGSALQIPDGGAGAAGTAVFNFESPVTLAPGAYAWRFIPTNASGTQSKWTLSSGNEYPAGQRYEGDAATVDQPAATGGNFVNEDYHFGFVGQSYLPKLIIDRTTGNISLQNTTSSPLANIVGYEINSIAATLNSSPAVWNAISETNSNWTRLTALGDNSNLSETETGGTSLTLAPGAAIDLGNVWLPWFIEAADLTAKIAIDDGSELGAFVNTEVRFVGGAANVQPYQLGDFDFDGNVDVNDYQTFLASLPANLNSLAVRDAYQQGDINLDSVVDFYDIAVFRSAYDAVNGTGAFAALESHSVPEPTGGLLALLAIATTFVVRKRAACQKFGNSVRRIACIAGVIGLWVTASIAMPGTAWAVLTSATNTNSLDPTDQYLLVPGGFQVGAKVNIDRTPTAQNVPILMQGLDYVQTANDDRNATNSPPFSLDLTFEPGTTLLLSIDAQVGDANTTNPPTLGSGVMDWVVEQGWKPTGMKWNKSGESTRPFHVYSLTPDGTSISLFEQNAGAYNMFSVAAGAAGTLFPAIVVNTDTGAISLTNPTSHTLAFDYYEITSQANGLNATGWTSLDQQNIDAIDGNDDGSFAGDSVLEGWDKSGGSHSGHLSELFLFGSSSLAPAASLPLGAPYSASLDTKDLVFKFSLAGSDDLYFGLVSYVTGGDILAGDFNGDGTVNLADYTVWRDNLGAAVNLPNDPTPGTVDATDYDVWKTHFGQTGTPAAFAAQTNSVPEPAGLALMVLIVTAAGCGYHTNQRGWVRD